MHTLKFSRHFPAYGYKIKMYVALKKIKNYNDKKLNKKVKTDKSPHECLLCNYLLKIM